mgnify:CR=1 FL=1
MNEEESEEEDEGLPTMERPYPGGDGGEVAELAPPDPSLGDWLCLGSLLSEFR